MSLFLGQNLTRSSYNWKHWISVLSITTCKTCADNHGKIFALDEDTTKYIPVHLFCKCKVEPMRTISVGRATYNGLRGADSYLFYTGRLPEYYITKKQAKLNGWIKKQGNLSNVLPHKMIGGDIFYNDEGKLPDDYGRIWHEADINYESGYRNDARILYSNDGLIFVSYDHYTTFYKITQ